MPPGIADAALLKLVGDILRPDPDAAALTALRLRLMAPGFSWQALVDLATGQDVMAPLVYSLTAKGLLLPVPRAATEGHATTRLRAFYDAHLARRRREEVQLGRVLAVLNAEDIVPVALKGARYVVAPHAPWCAARTLRDFDLLITPEEGARAMAALVASGYIAGDPYMDNYHHLPDLARDDEPASLELHTGALALGAQPYLPTALVREQAELTGDGRCRVQPLRWQALHGLLNHQVADRGHRRHMLVLKGLWEWTMLTRDFQPADWEAVIGQMRRAGGADVLGSWLLQSHALFGAPIPEAAEVSKAARAHAAATFRAAARPHWQRRGLFIVDQLRFSFAAETLAQRYSKPVSQVSITDAATYLAQLIRSHRGQMRRRLFGERNRPS